MPNEPSMHELVEQAYAALNAPAAPNAPQPPNPVEAAFQQLAAPAHPKPPADSTAEAYAQVPSDRALARFDQIEAARGNTANAFSGIAPRTVLMLMSCATLPPKGMVSALAPAALQPGQFSLLQDVRIDDRSIRARQPTANRNATGLPGLANSARGLWTGTLNGALYVVGCWYDGSKVGIYFSTDGTAFTAATVTSGPFSDSRMSDTGAPFAFTAVNNVDRQDYLVIQNGTDAPRVLLPTDVAGFRVRVVKQFSAPLWATAAHPIGLLQTPYLENLAAVSATGGLTAALNGSAPTQSVSITLGVTTAQGNQVLMDFGAGNLSFGNGQQIVFVSDQAGFNAWNSWRLELSADNITYFTLADPTSSTYNAPVRVPFSDTQFGGTSATGGLGGEELVAFDQTVLSTAVTSNLRYLRLTWKGGVIATSTTTTLHGIFESGAQLAFDQQYMVSFAGLGGLSESAGVTLSTFAAKTGTLISGISATNVYVPYAAGIFYDHAIPVQAQKLADLQNGCDSLSVYRLDQGASDFYFFGAYSLGQYTGGAWVYTATASTTPPASAEFTVPAATFLATALNVSWAAPDAYAQVLPVGLALATANGRTFVGGKNFYAVSEYGVPFRFRPALAFVNGAPLDRSATWVKLAGQTVTAFATPSGSALNSQTIFFWTQRKTYACGGFDGYSLSRPAVVFEIGCSAPASVAQYKDAIFWLDDNRQIRRFNYGRTFLYGYSNANAYELAPAISRMVVDDQTLAIPAASLGYVAGIATFDRYYLFYPPSGGGANTRALVFEENLQAFVQDSLGVGAQSACAADLPAGRRLLLAGADGALYTHEDPLSTTTLAVHLTTREVSEEMWRPLYFGRLGLAADVQTGQSAAIAVAVKPNANDSSSLDLGTSATNQVWRWASRTQTQPPGVDGETTTQPGVHGLAAQIDLQLTMTPGTRIYALALETAPALPGPDQL